MYYFDQYGWATDIPNPDRATDSEPPVCSNGQRPNWTGTHWVCAVYTAPPAAVAPPEDPRIWWVDTGPFRDRMGMDALAIGASTHDACKGVSSMLSDRQYVGLKDPRTAAMLDILIATNQPAANPIFPGSGPMTAAKKAAILNTPTTEYERHIKGLLP